MVYHTASPFFYGGLSVENADALMLAPALRGTRNVLGSVARTGATASRVVLTSSRAAVAFHPPPSRALYTEGDWSEEGYCRAAGHWYPLSKTLAEHAAWEWAAAHPRVRVVAVCPTLVIGPLQRGTVNTSVDMIRRLLVGADAAVPAGSVSFVDVRDVVDAHVAAATNVRAGGRYLCVPRNRSWCEVVEALRKIRPGARLPPAAPAAAGGASEPLPQFSAARLATLGVHFRDVRHCVMLGCVLDCVCRVGRRWMRLCAIRLRVSSTSACLTAAADQRCGRGTQQTCRDRGTFRAVPTCGVLLPARGYAYYSTLSYILSLLRRAAADEPVGAPRSYRG